MKIKYKLHAHTDTQAGSRGTFPRIAPADTGVCVDRCGKFPAIVTSGCTMQRDPNDPCCEIPVCTSGAPTLSPTSKPGEIPTVSPNQVPNSGKFPPVHQSSISALFTATTFGNKNKQLILMMSSCCSCVRLSGCAVHPGADVERRLRQALSL